MNFLRTVFWTVVAVIAALFAFENWTLVTVNLWGGLQMDTRLPVLLLIAFLIGLLPPLILHRATRWSLGRKLDTAERALADIRGPAPAPTGGTLPPAAAPIAAPPGVS